MKVVSRYINEPSAGDELSAGEVLCEVQTDKAVVALECEEDGVLAKILINEKSPPVQVGQLIAIIAEPDEDWKAIAASAPSVETATAPSPTAQAQVLTQPSSTEHVAESSSVATPSSRSTIGPAAKLLLSAHNLDASNIPATGPRGQLLKSDVLSYIASHKQESPPTPSSVSTQSPPHASIPTPAQPSSSQSFTDIPLTNMRMTIAKRLTFSKSTIPHAFVHRTASLDKLMSLRADLKSRLGITLSVNDLVIKACAYGLRMVPEMNALGDPAQGRITHCSTVDICMAVATPAGLITPILWDADRTPISKLSETAVQLAKKARDGKLQPHEFQGGSFTISNLGMFGIREFTAIINPPQVAILAVGSGLPKAAIASDQLHFTNQMSLTLSIDSRFVDELIAGRFLSHICDLLTNHPDLLLADDPRTADGLDQTKASQPDAFDMLSLSLSVDPKMRQVLTPS